MIEDMIIYMAVGFFAGVAFTALCFIVWLERVERRVSKAEGDIIDLGRTPDAPLHVLVENRPKYFALAGNHNGKKAIRISDKIKAGE